MNICYFFWYQQIELSLLKIRIKKIKIKMSTYKLILWIILLPLFLTYKSIFNHIFVITSTLSKLPLLAL